DGIGGAVNRVDNSVIAAGSGLATVLFADNPVIRPALVDCVADQGFGVLVGIRHEILVALALDHQRVDRLKMNSGESARLPGKLGGEVQSVLVLQGEIRSELKAETRFYANHAGLASPSGDCKRRRGRCKFGLFMLSSALARRANARPAKH